MPLTAITVNFPELINTVDGWRIKTVDVAKNGVPPHITLLFPDTPSYGGQYPNHIPHLTVAQGDSESIDCLNADVRADLERTLPLSCNVHEVSILEENTSGAWRVKANIALV